MKCQALHAGFTCASGLPIKLPTMARPLPVSPDPCRRLRVTLDEGARTTVYVASFERAETEIAVVAIQPPERLAAYCAAHRVQDAVVGGFFARPDGHPLGELRTRGVERRYEPFDSPWSANRACLHVQGGRPEIRRRDELPPAPRGDLLQAGPLLVRNGEPCFDRAKDEEGFSAGAHQFDSDITAERHPRAAIGLTESEIVVIACDGRARHDAGLTLEELATLLAEHGCETAMNLDGGGSTSLVVGGRLRNRPRKGPGRPETGGRPVSSALLFHARG